MVRCVKILIALVCVLSFSACSVLSTSADVDPPGSLGKLLFHDDFSSDSLDGQPSQWEVTTASGVRIAEDVEATEGIALEMVAVPHATTRIEKQLSAADSVVTIEYSFKWSEQDSTINHYIRQNDESVINLHFDRGGLYYRYKDENGTTQTVKVDDLQSGWNRIGLIADADQNEYYLFLNDTTTPRLGPLPLMESIDHWQAFSLRFMQRQDTRSSVSYYDDVSVWSFETSADAIAQIGGNES